MDYISSKNNSCPSCAGRLFFDPKEQMLICDSCGSVFSPEKIDILSRLSLYDHSDADEDENDKQEIVCDSCGAAIIATNSTSATFCSFCGSQALITRRLTKQFRPDCLIPFKVTKKDAIEKIKEFAANSKYAPKHFFNNKNITKLTGIYVPFWLMNTKCRMHTLGFGYKESLSETRKYRVITDFMIGFKDVPFDGAVNMRDELMEAIEPFDCSELVNFSSSYLQGYYSQRYDLSVDKLSDRIIYRLRRYGKQAVTESLKKYDKFDCDSCNFFTDELEQKYALFPVWLLTYKYRGKNYQIAVNGQTGKTDGDLPVCKLKKYIRLAGYHLLNLLISLPLLAAVVALIFGIRSWAIYHPAIAFVLSVLIVAMAIIVPVLFKIFDYKNSYEYEVLRKYNIFNPIKRWIKKLINHRINARKKILDQTEMRLGDNPAFDTYYDQKTISEVNNDEVYIENESLFDADRL